MRCSICRATAMCWIERKEADEMEIRNKKMIKGIVVIFLVCLGFIYYSRPQAYVRWCAKVNEEELAVITDCLREAYSSGDTHIRYVTDGDAASIEADAPEEIKTVLLELQDKYQKDKWPVFSFVEVYYDEQGDMMYEICVKTEKTEGDGMESPDLRCCYLIYIDDGYDGKQMETHAEVIFGNWHYWAKDTYSG